MLWISPGFAHGFYVTTTTVEFLYKCRTSFYAPDQERCIRWDDPDLAIDWPLVEGRPPLLSERAATGRAIRDAEHYSWRPCPPAPTAGPDRSARERCLGQPTGRVPWA